MLLPQPPAPSTSFLSTLASILIHLFSISLTFFQSNDSHHYLYPPPSLSLSTLSLPLTDRLHALPLQAPHQRGFTYQYLTFTGATGGLQTLPKHILLVLTRASHVPWSGYTTCLNTRYLPCLGSTGKVTEQHSSSNTQIRHTLESGASTSLYHGEKESLGNNEFLWKHSSVGYSHFNQGVTYQLESLDSVSHTSLITHPGLGLTLRSKTSTHVRLLH